MGKQGIERVFLKEYAINQRLERIEDDVHNIKNEIGDMKFQFKAAPSFVYL